MWNFVSLNFLASEGIGFVPAKNVDHTVMEDESPPVSSLKGRGETTAKSKERTLSTLHVRFDEVGLKGVHKFRIVTQYQIWALRPATLKRGPFESAFAPLCIPNFVAPSNP